MKKEKITNIDKAFTIDFFELAFLTEACLPPSPIARNTFFMNVIDVHYHKMSKDQRQHFFTWIGSKLNMEYEDSKLFHARFNPDNQYLVTSIYQHEKQQTEAFLHEEKYMISSNRFVNDKYIESVDKIK